MIMETIVHLADLGGPTKPWELSRIWTARILTEFFNEGREEKRTGLKVGPLNDETSVMTAKSQQGFLSFVVLPLWETWDAFTATHVKIKANPSSDMPAFMMTEAEQGLASHTHMKPIKMACKQHLD